MRSHGIRDRIVNNLRSALARASLVHRTPGACGSELPQLDPLVTGVPALVAVAKRDPLQIEGRVRDRVLHGPLVDLLERLARVAGSQERDVVAVALDADDDVLSIAHRPRLQLVARVETS